MNNQNIVEKVVSLSAVDLYDNQSIQTVDWMENVGVSVGNDYLVPIALSRLQLVKHEEVSAINASINAALIYLGDYLRGRGASVQRAIMKSVKAEGGLYLYKKLVPK
jgi:hypothetical protein